MSLPAITNERAVPIDGGAGTGKSTLAGLLAERTGGLHLNSGMIYRAVAWLVMEDSMDLDDFSGIQLVELAKSRRLTMDPEILGKPEVSAGASRVAVIPEVRRYVNEILVAQTNAFDGWVFMDGRAGAWELLSDATVKIYLEVDDEAAAARRGDTAQGVQERNRRDAERGTAPMKPAPDAVVINTTHLSAEEVADEVMRLISQQLLN